MAELIRAKISDIHVGERARPIVEQEAEAIAASMAERGQINPITVRRTPAANGGKTPLTLVTGGHRWRGGTINGWDEIDAIVVSADAVEAQLLELTENLYRNELSALDRAIFVMKYRELWEEKNGKIARGGDRRAKGHDGLLIYAGGRELSSRVCEQLGIGERTYKRAVAIAHKLHPELRATLRGTGGERDQSLLLKLAKKGPSEQAAIAGALREERDIKKVLATLKGEKPKVDLQEDIFQKVTALLAKADDDTLVRVLHHIGEKRDVSFLEAAE